MPSVLSYSHIKYGLAQDTWFCLDVIAGRRATWSSSDYRKSHWEILCVKVLIRFRFQLSENSWRSSSSQTSMKQIYPQIFTMFLFDMKIGYIGKRRACSLYVSSDMAFVQECKQQSAHTKGSSTTFVVCLLRSSTPTVKTSILRSGPHTFIGRDLSLCLYHRNSVKALWLCSHVTVATWK
jgi:hypothetical protein